MTRRNAQRHSRREHYDTAAVSNIRWAYLLSTVLLVLMLLLLVKLGREPLIELVDRPVSQVVVEGQFRYVDKANISRLVSPEIDRSFLQLDLDKIKQKVEAQPWVKRVSLSRQWPDRLQVLVYEQTPIARWNKRGFLSVEGQAVEAEDAEQLLKNLPQLIGPEEQSVGIMSLYQQLSQLLSAQNLGIEALEVDARRSWTLTLSNQWQLVIGRHQVIEKIQRFTTVYERVLKNKQQPISSIDLRYQNGFAVSWQ